MNNEDNITNIQEEDDFEDILEDDFEDILEDDFEDILEDDDNKVDNFDDLLEDNNLLEDGDFSDLFSDDDFDDLLEDGSEVVSNEIVQQSKYENIQDALEFMKWSNNCLKEKWVAIPTSPMHTNAYTKLTKQSENIVTYLNAKEACKKSSLLNGLIPFIRCNFAIKRKVLSNAITQLNKPASVVELQFCDAVLRCKTFDEYSKIPCSEPQIKETQLKEIQLMRKIWELEENEKVPTKAMCEVENYRKLLDKDLVTLSTLTPDQCVTPTNIEYNEGNYKITCECGNIFTTTNLITFNIINIDSEDLSRSKLNELTDNCREDRIARWLKELQEPDRVFNNPSNKEMIENLELAKDTLSHGVYSLYRNYIYTSYGCACRFNPDVVCSCGKHIVLPAKLLRYFSTWHSSHGDDIYRYYSDNVISPGMITYRDDILIDKFEAYQRNVYSTGENDIQRAINSLTGDIDTESLRRNLAVRMEIEAGPKLERNKYKLATTRSVKDAYDRIRAREFKHTVNLSRYMEENLQSKNTPVRSINDYKNTLPLDYWRSYNTSQDDKLLASLVYIVNSLNLPFDTSPKAVLSEIFRAPGAKRVRDIILLQAWFTTIICNFCIYESYLDKSDVSADIRSVDSTYGTWRLDNSNKYELLDTIILYLRKYSEIADVFTEDELKELEDYTTVDYTTIKKFIEKLKLKHSIPYEVIRNPKNFNPPHITEVHNIDIEFIRYITDELPWRVWYKLALVSLIEKYSPQIFSSKSSSTGATRRENKLKTEIVLSAIKGDMLASRYFWNKIPQAIRGDSIAVLNKNLQEVALSTITVPLPLTSNMIALLLQSDNLTDSKLKVENYIKTGLIQDVMERYSLDDISFDVATLDTEKVWLDALEWVKLYTPDSFTFALPKYIREFNIEVV